MYGARAYVNGWVENTGSIARNALKTWVHCSSYSCRRKSWEETPAGVQ